MEVDKGQEELARVSMRSVSILVLQRKEIAAATSQAQRDSRVTVRFIGTRVEPVHHRQPTAQKEPESDERQVPTRPRPEESRLTKRQRARKGPQRAKTRRQVGTGVVKTGFATCE